MKITVCFYGVLAEVAGAGLKVYHDAATIGSLMLMIGDEYPEIIHYSYRISLNHELVTGDDHPLKDGDEVVLLPPFAGG